MYYQTRKNNKNVINRCDNDFMFYVLGSWVKENEGEKKQKQINQEEEQVGDTKITVEQKSRK